MRSGFLLIACTSVLAACSVIRRPDPASCAPGVWLRGDIGCTPCARSVCEPCASEPTAECGQYDCVAFDALLLDEDGRYLEMSLRRLEFTRQLSALHIPGAESTGDWWIDADGRLVQESDAGARRVSPLACDSVSLRRGQEVFGLSRVTLASALRGAWATADWRTPIALPLTACASNSFEGLASVGLGRTIDPLDACVRADPGLEEQLLRFAGDHRDEYFLFDY